MQTTKTLHKNTIANYVGLGYTTIVGIVVMPLYLQFLGAEAFGLIGFFTVLLSWMQLLDMGMSPLLSRQAAMARSSKINFLELKKLLRSLELIIAILTLAVIFGISGGSDWIASNWLSIGSLVLTEVEICIVLMGVIVGLQFFSSLYRGGIRGMENQVTLNVANIVLVTFKFFGALLLLRYVTQSLVYYFAYQLIIGLLELVVLSTLLYKSLPPTNSIGFSFFWRTLKPALPFAGGIAYTSGIWVLLTQLDKLILSNVLPLSEYGYFALVAIVAAGIIQISSPISQAILPRMTYLLSQGGEQQMLLIYRNSTQLMAAIMLPLTGMIALFSTELLFAWTGDRQAADWAGPVLFWFALGNGILAISAFQYYLQFAHGKLKMHVFYNTISAIIQVPVIIFVAFEYGALGVALTWFILRLISFIIWTPIVHSKFAPGLHWPWLFVDIAPLFLSTCVMLLFIKSIGINFDSMDRSTTFFFLIGIGLVILILNMFVSSSCRKLIITFIKKG